MYPIYPQVMLDRESPRSSNGAYILAIQGRRVFPKFVTCSISDTTLIQYGALWQHNVYLVQNRVFSLQ